MSVSDVVLAAVLERAVLNARDHFRWFRALPAVDHSIDVSFLRVPGGRVRAADVKEALRFVVVEFVAVNGNMTGETLSPAMHKALAKVRWKRTPRRSKGDSEK